MVEVTGFVKECFKDKRNSLLSTHLVGSSKRNKIKSQQEKFELETKRNFLMVYLELLPSRCCMEEQTDVCQKGCRGIGSCCGPGHGPYDICVTPACSWLYEWAEKRNVKQLKIQMVRFSF